MKTSNAVALQYEDLTVHFTGDAWFNATEAAEKYGKRPVDWLALDSTKDYIKSLKKAFRSEKSSLLNVKKGGRGKSDSTWFHPKLAVVFARWLDMDFAVWCDMQIDALIRGTHDYSNPPREKYIHAKRDAHRLTMDSLIEFRESLGKETGTVQFMSENKMMNWVVTGKFEKAEEGSLSNEEITVLEKVRLQNACMIDAGLSYDERKAGLVKFAATYRARRSTIKLVESA